MCKMHPPADKLPDPNLIETDAKDQIEETTTKEKTHLARPKRNAQRDSAVPFAKGNLHFRDRSTHG